METTVQVSDGLGKALAGIAAPPAIEPTRLIGDKKAPRRGLLGEILIREGLITEDHLQEALRLQRDVEARTPLGQILVNMEVLTQRQLNRILDSYRKKYRLGDILVEVEAIAEDQLQIALDHQRRTGLRLGDVLLQLNFVTEEDLNQALCTQFGITFVDLDRLILDRSLTSLVDKQYAQRHRVIPISKFQDNIAVVMDDPSDLTVTAELRQMTGCRVNVVTSTRAAFQRAFARAYGESPESGLSRQHEELGRAYDLLRRQHEESVRMLDELRRAHDAWTGERAEITRILDEQRERNEANSRTLAQLQAAQQEQLREHAAALEAHAALERARDEVAATLAASLLGQATLAQGLEELRGIYADVVSERDGLARRLEEQQEQHEWTMRVMVKLQSAHEALEREHQARLAEVGAATAERDALADQLAAARERERAAGESLGVLRERLAGLAAEHESAVRHLEEQREINERNVHALAELQASHELLRRDQEEGAEALHRLCERHAATTAALEAAQEAAREEYETRAGELTARCAALLADREAAAAQLEAALARLKG